MRDVDNLVKNILTRQLTQAVTRADGAAIRIANSWSNPMTGNQPGLHWITYRAVCRNEGVFRRRKETIDFPAQLTEPFNEEMDPRWVRIFTKKIPAKFAEAIDSHEQYIEDFRGGFVESLMARGAMAHESVFNEQLQRFAVTFEHIMRKVEKSISTQQKSTNRCGLESVNTYMLPVFAECGAQTGKGSYQRMKDIMEQGVSNLTGAKGMFGEVKNKIRSNMKQMIDGVSASAKADLERSQAELRADCENLILSGPSGFEEFEQSTQNKLLTVLAEAEQSFGTLINSIDLESLDKIGKDDFVPVKKEDVSEDEISLKELQMSDSDEEDTGR